MNKQKRIKSKIFQLNAQLGRRWLAMMLCLSLIVGLFTPLTVVPIQANGRYIHAAYNIDTNSYEFRVKADGADYGFIRGGFNGWSMEETFKLVRQDNDQAKTGEMFLSVPAHLIEGKNNEYKAYLYYAEDSQVPAEIKDKSNSNYAWMKADGGNADGNEHLAVVQRLVKTTYQPSPDGTQEDRVTFTVKANGALYGYVRSHGDWSIDNIDEKYKFTREDTDTGRNGTMSVTIDYKDLIDESKVENGKPKAEFKVILKYENNPNYVWIRADGSEGDGNSPLPERSGAPNQQPQPNPQPEKIKSVRTVFHPASGTEESKVEFIIRADGIGEVFVMTQSTGWGTGDFNGNGPIRPELLNNYKAVRPVSDTDGTGELSVTIPYSKLAHWYKKYQYKIYALHEGKALWFNAEGKDAENSFFPTEEGENYDNILEAVVLDEANTVKAVLKQGYENINTEYEIWIDGIKKGSFAPNKDNANLTFDISGLWNNDFDIRSVMKIVRKNGITKKNIVKRNILDRYVYDGNDMGVSHTDAGINLKLWAPTAQAVEVLLYDSYTNDGFETEKENPIYKKNLDYNPSTGIYSTTLEKGFADKFYLYRLTFGEEKKYAVDPYAVAVGVNGKMGALVDMNDPETKPEGFDADQRPALNNPEDSIIYEMHVRDFTINPYWNGPSQKAGKYLGVIEKGTTYTDAASGITVKTGLDHLIELGITHVHLLPTYDFATINEDAPAPYDSTSANEKANQRNWGYDPKNFNAPDGSYSMQPHNPKTRIKEYREMVMGLHKAGIRVINDVVYNHMYDMENMNKIVEGYYFRSFPNGVYSNDSGVGNAIASERPMVRKFIVDSSNHWVDQYKIDGLRFDLMAILDTTTMKKIKADMDQKNQNILVYGEPWMAAGSPLPENEQTKKTSNIGFFNDTYRDALRGNNNPSKGYVTNDVKKLADVLSGIRANDASDPEYIINYVEAHDNYAIWDQVEKSENSSIADGSYRMGIPENALENWRVDKSLLANAFVFLSQGIPFFQGGSEILRTKQGDHNSYRSNDVINDIDWNDKATFKEVFDYYKGLIQIRKEQSLFRLTTKEAIAKHQVVERLNNKDDMIFQYLKDNPNEQEWDNIVVLYNASNEERTINWLPGEHSEWKVVADDRGVYLEQEESERRTVTKEANGQFNFRIAANSLMILYNDSGKPKADIHWHYLYADQSSDYMEPLEPTAAEEVAVRMRAKAGELTAAEVHYYVEGEADVKILPMTEVADSFYQERGYDKTKVTFFEAKIPASNKKKYYHFKAINSRVAGQEKVAFISAGKGEDGRGVRQSQGANGFAIVPNYKTSKWSRESVFYQIMVDRFRDGDTTNNKTVYDFADNGDRPELSRWNEEVNKGTESDKIWNNQFFGGDLIGVKEAIPYLKNTLGVDALYFMPVFESDSDHKYDNSTYELVDDSFGGNKALADLGKTLNQNGMNYILDGAFNHSSSTGKLFKEHRELFFKGKYRDEKGVEYDHFPWHQKYFNFAKLDYSNSLTKEYIYKGESAIAKRYLKAPYYAGGWRLDAAEDVSEIARDYKVGDQTDEEQKNSNLRIWQEFKQEIHKVNPDAFILGEYWGNENHWYFGNAWDGKMNYGGFYLPFIENRQKNQWLGNQSLDNKGDMSVAEMIRFAKEYNSGFPYATILNSTNSLSTHDKPRFSNVDYVGKNNVAMMQLAQTLQMTMPGIPLIYYGDEIGSHGKGDGNDPYNRQTFNWNDDEWNYEMLNNYRKLIATRKSHKEAFVYGALEEVANSHEQKYVAFARYGKNDRAIIVLNNNGSDTSRKIEIADVTRLGLKDGDRLVDVLSGNTVTVAGDKLTLQSKDMAAACYVLADGNVALQDLNADDYKVEEVLRKENDLREVLGAPSQVVYEKVGTAVRLSYQLPQGDVVAGALVRVVSADNSMEVKKVMLPKGQNSVLLEGVPADAKIVVKAVSQKGVDSEEAILGQKKDSVYIQAVEKVVVPQQPQQPQQPSPSPLPPYSPQTGEKAKQDSKEAMTGKETKKPEVRLEVKPAEALPNQFVDTENHYAKEAIDYVASRGIMTGVSKTEFAAEMTMNRAMLITILGRLSQVDTEKYQNQVFADVKAGSYYGPYVAWGYANGLIKGVSDKEYAPETELTREQVATILTRFIKVLNLKRNSRQKVTFKDDAAISEYAKESALFLQQNGIMIGAEGYFRPQQALKRGEMSLILKRLIELSLQK